MCANQILHKEQYNKIIPSVVENRSTLSTRKSKFHAIAYQDQLMMLHQEPATRVRIEDNEQAPEYAAV